MLRGRSCACLGDSRGLSGLGARRSLLPAGLQALEVQGKAAGGPGDAGAPCSPWMDVNTELGIGSGCIPPTLPLGWERQRLVRFLLF